jgi:hypothetical protein
MHQEIAQHLETDPLAFFRMELQANQIVDANRRNEAATIRCASKHNLVIASDMIAIGEIEVRAWFDAFENAGVMLRDDLIPTHMRDTFRTAGRGQPFGLAVYQTKAFAEAILETTIRQELHSKADAKKWNWSARQLFTNSLIHAGGLQIAHRHDERSNSGKDDTVCLAKVRRIIRNHRPAATLFNGSRNRIEIAATVIYDRDLAHAIYDLSFIIVIDFPKITVSILDQIILVITHEQSLIREPVANLNKFINGNLDFCKDVFDRAP